jgi:hypothetical protein
MGSDPFLIPIHTAVAGYYGLVDLPLSLVGDTLTLPRVLSRRKKYQEACRQKLNSPATTDSDSQGRTAADTATEADTGR